MVKLINETVCLNLNQTAELFQRNKSVVSRHISNVFRTGELSKGATVAKYATVQIEGWQGNDKERGGNSAVPVND